MLDAPPTEVLATFDAPLYEVGVAHNADLKIKNNAPLVVYEPSFDIVAANPMKHSSHRIMLDVPLDDNLIFRFPSNATTHAWKNINNELLGPFKVKPVKKQLHIHIFISLVVVKLAFLI